jgi:hypothetical protein
VNRGKVTELSNGVTRDVANGWFVGEPLEVWYDYQRVGIWQNTSADSAEAKRLGLPVTGNASVIGTIRVADLSGPNENRTARLMQRTIELLWAPLSQNGREA